MYVCVHSCEYLYVCTFCLIGFPDSSHPQDPYSKTAQEKARLEAQQRLMGIDTNKKPKKTKKKSLAAESLYGK